MSIKQLIFQNLKANLKHYYLYVFALIFSVALYFAFVTLQYDPALDNAKGSMNGAAGLRAASVLLVAIVAIFNLYANTIFVKRRSKEIGLLQLIGLTKNAIFRILSAENIILYFCSLLVGMGVGFSFSKLIMIVLLKITGVEATADLRFSPEALVQTFIIFSALYVLILFANYTFIKRQTILSLFRVTSSTEAKIKKVSFFEALMGLAGFALIVVGYYVSSELFGGRFKSVDELFSAMVFILASVIIGTYLFYKGTVRLVFNIIRKYKNGKVTVKDVMSLTSIMFRMKSNALMLTIITTLSALAIGLLSLSYISYYSAEKIAKNNVPAHFTFSDPIAAVTFSDALTEQSIDYRKTVIDVLMATADITEIVENDQREFMTDMSESIIAVIPDTSVEGIDVSANETLFSGYNDILQQFIGMKKSGDITLQGKTFSIPQKYIGMRKDYLISWYYTAGGAPTAIVDDKVFQQLKGDLDPSIQKEFSTYIGIDIVKENKLAAANDIFHQLGYHETSHSDSQLDMYLSQKEMMGLTMFIVGFLGLAFLVTSGCILYFKQMDESQEEKPTYTILRKLGFTQTDLLRGVQYKQLFNFGIPLLVGLSHSYFAVQSGWFLFGTELWTPMIVVMVLYAALYSIFGVLSVLHYKRVIRESL